MSEQETSKEEFAEKAEPKQTLEQRLEALHDETQETFFVYDNRNPHWGHSFQFREQQKIEGVPVNSFRGFREWRTPKEGDRVVTEVKKGTPGLFMVFDVERSRDPRDLFHCKAVCLDNDYKGGFGLKGEEETEPNLDPVIQLQKGLAKAGRPDLALNVK